MQDNRICILPCMDSNEMAEARRRELDIPRNVAATLGRSAVEAAENGYYLNRAGEKVDWAHLVNAACSAKRSIAPDAPLSKSERIPFDETRIQVANETTLGASLRLVESGLRPLALNFANGIHPGGGFLAVPEPKKKCSVDPALCTGQPQSPMPQLRGHSVVRPSTTTLRYG